jgi:hypothetical protein
MSAIVTPDLLARFVVTTLTFDDLASLDGQELGVANDPYACIGLTFSNAVPARNASRSDAGAAARHDSRTKPPAPLPIAR